MPVTIRVLGGFAVEADGRTLVADPVPRRSAAALLKLLALSPGRRLHRERVLDALWPDVDPAEAAPRLHKAAHYARRTLGLPEGVVVRGDVVALLPDADVRTDLAAFEEAADVALARGDAEAARAAAALCPGDLLPGDLYEPWADDARQRVAVKRAAVLRLGECWEELVRLDATDEEAQAALVARHLAAGDPAAALRQLEWYEVACRRELGEEPSPRMARLRSDVTARLRREGLAPGDDVRLTQEIRFCRTPDGVRLAYAMTGQGPPLVKAANWLTHLDHDWRSPVWRHWLVGLSRHRTLVRYDERGCGLSDRDVAEHSFEAWVRDLEAVVDAAGLERFPVLGLSQGAGVAVAYAARHPERVSRLVLYGGFAQGRRHRASGPAELAEHELELQVTRGGWGSDNPAFRQVFTSQFMPQASRELWAEFNELQRRTAHPDDAAAILAVSASIDVMAEAPLVRAPTLVLHARDDRRPPFSQGLLLASLVPGARFVALDSANHILLEDEPAWPVFLREVEAFLAEE